MQTCNKRKNRGNVLVGLLALAMLVAAGGGCAAPQATAEDETSTAGLYRVAGIPRDILDKAGLEVLWNIDLPMLRSKRVEHIFYRNGRVYAVDDRNTLIAVEGETGIVEWTTRLAGATEGCSTPTFPDGTILLVVGNTLVQVRASDGTILAQHEPDVSITTNAVRADSLFLFGGGDRRFHALKAKTWIPEWRTLVRRQPRGSVATTGDRVFFVTRDNTLYVSRTLDRELVWKFQANGSLCGVLVDGDQCLLPSEDTTLYCLNPSNGRVLWQHLSGGRLEELPVVTTNAIYQPVAGKSLLCVEREAREGQRVRWELPDGRCLLSENGDRTYALTHSNTLAVMDNARGQVILTFYTPGTELAVSNIEDNLIVLASRDGNVLALRPRTRAGVPTPVVAPTEQGPAGPTEPKPVVVESLVGVGSVQFGMTRQQVQQVLGEPDDASNEQMFQYREQGLAIAFGDGGEVTEIQAGGLTLPGETPATTWNFRTSQGIGLGATTQAVRDAYGEPSWQSEQVLAYGAQGLFFQLVNGRVSAIGLQREPF